MRTKRRVVDGACAVVLIAGLAFASSSAIAQPSKRSAEQGNVHGVPLADPAFDSAAREARRTLPIFLAKWRAKPAGYAAFRVKAAFRTDDGLGDEYLWFEPQTVSANGQMSGRLSNDTTRILKMKMGSSVQVEPRKIVDWMYVKDRRMFGQFTMRAQLDRATPQQRAQFEAVLSPTPLEQSSN
jgi:uncharacterized protein YegJ (DUF2314 family)